MAPPALIPASPSGRKGVKFRAFTAVNAIAQNSTSVPIFTATMIVLARALSFAPDSSRSIASSTTTMAGTLTMPPEPGGWLSASGMAKPNASRSSSLRYCPQPTATDATDTPYSRTRHQPHTHATSSPSVA